MLAVSGEFESSVFSCEECAFCHDDAVGPDDEVLRIQLSLPHNRTSKMAASC